MSDNKVTMDQLDNSAIEAMAGSIGNVNMLNTENKTIVGAITEIVGKKVIADAIGEPLAETDKFTEMGSEINGLLSAFKTNMMNAGVVVESGDKFKALIDKIKGLTEGEGNKGIQFAEGTLGNLSVLSGGYQTNTNVTMNLDFIPNYIFINMNYTINNISGNPSITNMIICNMLNQTILLTFGGSETYSFSTSITNLSSTGFNINISGSNYGKLYVSLGEYYAIGVGEEDTTLRDSLADILEGKGVDVTEEDDMASLISKVDSISGGLDIISATELPATGRENQICVITDVEPSNFIITTDFTDVDFTSNDIFVYQGTSIAKDLSFGTKVAITNDKVTNNQYFCKVCQGTDRLDSYIYQNNLWNQLTLSKILLYENYKFYNSSVFGSITSSQSTAGEFYWDSSTHITRSYNGSYYASKVFNKKIDFSLYNKIEVLAYKNHSDSTSLTFGANENATASGGSSMPSLKYSKSNTISSTSIKSYEYDISSWTGEYYLTMVGGRAGGFAITAIYIY